MKKNRMRTVAVVLAVVLAVSLCPAAVFADTAPESAAAVSAAADSTEAGQAEMVLETSETESEYIQDAAADITVYEASGEATSQDAETETTYALAMEVTTQAVSSSNKAVKTVKITKPALTETVADAETGETVASETISYTLTLECYVQGTGWVKADLNDAGTAYTYTASKAASGSYIQAVRITPSDSLKKAMKKAGLSFYYRANVKGFGSLGWAKAGKKAGTDETNCALKGLKLKIASSAPGDTDNSFIAKTTVSYKTKKTGSAKYTGTRKNGKTSGSASVSASIGTVSVSAGSSTLDGSICFKVRTTHNGKSSKVSGWKSSGSAAGGKNKSIEMIQIKLTGDLADYYDVYYRVYVGRYGWLDWAGNGEKAGAKYQGFSIGAVQIKLVPKGKSAPGSTSDPYIDSISGDKTLDKYLGKIYAKVGTNLYDLYEYVSGYTYYRTYDTPSGSWKKWSIPYAKQMYKHQYGNCYRYAALFCWLARGLGYNAKTVKGYVPSRSRGWAPHGWVEFRINGKTYICDPDLYKDYPNYNWYMRTYSNAVVTYKKA